MSGRQDAEPRGWDELAKANTGRGLWHPSTGRVGAPKSSIIHDYEGHYRNRIIAHDILHAIIGAFCPITSLLIRLSEGGAESERPR